ncbi:ATP-dependent DNA helicase [Frankliniella fusca]|uniref:ATP-dependent DNA helicase n=1 Tax=Frankliniella fusca TaxID=407009 RepID=A0AAE1HBL0_9NEOP|nr:ATP-dependent DNA helicase [Frankliniella fusca]
MNIYEELSEDVQNAIDEDDDLFIEPDTDYDTDDTDDNDELVYTSVPDSNHPSVSKSFRNELVWPMIGSMPLNEFSSPGYLSMAFPYLFPYGRCDFSMPRERKVSFKDYIHHLMSYKDQRFAKDERFRYFIMNTQMRWESLNIGNVYVKKNSIFSKMTILQLKAYFKENPWIINQIMHFGSRMRSTKSYWNSRCSELLDMVNQIGAPTVFFTLSSADYHWPDLYRLLGHDVSKLSAKEKGILLADNPLIADSFFYLGSNFFLENSFTNHFDVKDIWFRYEYQHRCSIHLHGLAWLKGAPHVSENMSEDQKKVALEYFDNLISCSNPDIHVLPLTQHPCQISLENVTDVDTDLAHLLNQVQRHTKCSKNHCLRVTGKEKKLQCRYKFPKSLTSETTFEMKENDIVDINFKRNDVFMNKYNPWLLQTWRANIDFSPVISKRVVYQYIAKYASKSEIKSICYNKVLTDILNKGCDESECAKKAIRKLLISTCAERDYCSQEVMHYLMGYHFYHSSRDFVVLNLKNLDWTSVSYRGNQKNILDMYAARPRRFDKFSLFEFAKVLYICKTDVFIRSRHAVVRCFPRIQQDIPFDNLLRHITVLFFPWRSLDDLLYVDDDMRQYSLRLFSKYMKTPNLEDLDDNDEDFSEIKTRASSEGNDVVHVLSSYNPNKTHQSTRSEQLHNLYMRWDYLSSKLTLDTIHIITELLQSETKTHRPDVMDYSVLNSDQKRVFKHIMSIAEKISKGDQSSFEFLIVQGMAGTGKTYLLKCCAQYVKTKLGDRALKLLAPTGVAAKIINGTTLHSFLSLGRYGFGVTRLTGIELLNYQQKHSGLKFLLVDEYSMVGLKMLALIDQRCRDLTGMEEIFGNLVIVFFGDINQLMPASPSRSSSSWVQRGASAPDEELHLCSLNTAECTERRSSYKCIDDVADGLPNVLEVSLGSKIMLRRNLNVSRGLVNGSIGVVKHILYEKGKKPPSLPERKVSHKDRGKLANEEDKRKMKQRLYKRMYRKKLSVKQKETCKEKDKIYRRLKRMKEKLKKKMLSRKDPCKY